MGHNVYRGVTWVYSTALGFFETLLDTIVPLRERSARTKARTIVDIPLCPSSHDLLGAKIVTLMDYQNPAAQDLVRSLKYDKSTHAASLAAEIIADYLREEIGSQTTFSPRKVLIVPIPLHAARYRERGFNQIGIALEKLPDEFTNGTLATLSPHTLVRTRETEPQTRLPRNERLQNVAGAFETQDAETLNGTHIYLIDDVTTTGATLVNASAPLKRAGATVSLIALARA
jgi:ComF family protein